MRRPIKLLGDVFSNLWVGRRLAFRLFMRNIAGQYRQTFMGYLWILVPTIIQICTWSFLSQQRVLRSEGLGNTSFIVFISIGTVLWQTFFDAFQAPLKATSNNSGLFTKLNLPREAFALVALGEVLFNFAVRMIIVLLVCIPFGLHLSALLPALIWMAGLIILGIAFGLWLTPIGTLYQDIGRSISILSPFWMILTPVIYLTPKDESYQIWMWLNPPAGMLAASRDLLVLGTCDMGPALLWLFLTVPLLVSGLVWYRIAFPIVIERMAN